MHVKCNETDDDGNDARTAVLAGTLIMALIVTVVLLTTDNMQMQDQTEKIKSFLLGIMKPNL